VLYNNVEGCLAIAECSLQTYNVICPMFIDIKNALQAQFKKLTSAGQLFQVEVDREKIWDIYINAFDPSKRQENICNCCKSFMRQFGGIVAIDANNNKITLWDFDSSIDPEYEAPVKAVQAYIQSLPVVGKFLNTFAKCGTDKNFDIKAQVEWNHFYVELPRTSVNSDPAPVIAENRETKNVLTRGVNEITPDAVSTVLELIAQNGLYRGTDYKANILAFQKIQDKARTIPLPSDRDNFLWLKANTESVAACRIKNTAIGTLLMDLSEGKDINLAVKAFERMVAPTNYKRPTAIVTKSMVDDAEKTIKELGYETALNRRMLNMTDVSVTDALFISRDAAKKANTLFAEMREATLVNPKSLQKVDSVTVTDFIDKILPHSKSVKVLVENGHLGNFVTMVGASDENAPNILKWEKPVSWAYTGDVADSIKERVKAAGGSVTGVLRISLAWSNYDDLDLHVKTPKAGEIYYGSKRLGGGVLDVDMNAGSGTTREPVENVTWDNTPPEGTYIVSVNNFSKRETKDEGFDVEIEFNGELFNFSFPKNGSNTHTFEVAKFKYSRASGFEMLTPTNGGTQKASYNSKSKWNINTGIFHPAQFICLSPNFWGNSNVGNKQLFFMLKDCKPDEKIRPFYNEMLPDNLTTHRKVFELLGSKIEAAKVEDPLAGLGFSLTQKQHVYVEVEGTFKRVLKVEF